MRYNNIAVVKLSALGDIVHTLPVLAVIRSKFPGCSITWFVEPQGAELLQNFSGIDSIVRVDLKTGSVLNRLGNLKRTLSVHRGKFDIILDFQGLIKSAVFSRLIGKNTAGFSKSNLRESAAGLFYKKIPAPFNENEHVIRKNIHLLSSIGIFSDNIAYPLKTLSFSEGTEKFLKHAGLEPGKFVILNVGGGWETKLLSVEQNLEILDDVDPGFKKVVLWGNRNEEAKADLLSKGPGIIKVPFLNFTDLILLIANAGFIISADSLPLHIADATGTRSVGIFGPTSPERNGTLNRNSISVVEEIDCSFCFKRKCSHKSCIEKIDLSLITEFVNNS